MQEDEFTFLHDKQAEMKQMLFGLKLLCPSMQSSPQILRTFVCCAADPFLHFPGEHHKIRILLIEGRWLD